MKAQAVRSALPWSPARHPSMQRNWPDQKNHRLDSLPVLSGTGAGRHTGERRIGIAGQLNCSGRGKDHVATTRPGGPMPKHQEKGRRSGCSIRTSPTKSIQSKMSSDLMNLIELFGGSPPTLPAKGMESLLQFRRYGCGINVARSRRNLSTGRDRQWTPAKWCPPRNCSM
jgi:hypothetical protein